MEEFGENCVDISKFGNFWKSTVDFEEYFKKRTSKEEKDCFSEIMGVSITTIEELESVCSPDTLTIPEYNGSDASRILTRTEPVPLATVRNQLEDMENRKSTAYKHVRLSRMKYRLLDAFLTPVVDNAVVPSEFRVHGGETLMQVTIYRSKKPHDQKKNKYMADHSFRVLGSQCLTDLRDEIRCASDLVVPGDFSNTPDLATDVCAKDLYKSAFFYIEDVFYNDQRTRDTIDYSQPIIDWAKAKKVKIFTSKDMATTNFHDLKLKLGVPYLYLHQGDCEHILVFTELRMVHPSDDLDARNYPLMVMRSARCRTLCHVCQNNTARWLTYNDELAPQSPCYFCDRCFRALHYNENNEKVCNFEAYKYFHGHVVT